MFTEQFERRETFARIVVCTGGHGVMRHDVPETVEEMHGELREGEYRARAC